MHGQFGMIITLRMDTDQASAAEARAWAEKCAAEIVEKFPDIAGTEYRKSFVVHPLHVGDIEKAVEGL